MIEEEKEKAIQEILHGMTWDERRELVRDLYEFGDVSRVLVRSLLGIDEESFSDEVTTYRMEWLEYRFSTLSGDFLARKVEQIREEQGEY